MSGSWRWVTNFDLAGTALFHPGLDVGLGQCDARRAAIDHAADRRPMAFAKGGDAEQVAECVVRHVLNPEAVYPMEPGLETAPSGARQLHDLRAPHSEDHALRLVQGRHMRRVQAQEQAAQDAGGGAMADGEGVGLQVADPGRQRGRRRPHNSRRPAPGTFHLSCRAAVVIGRIECPCLVVGQLVPASQIDLLDARIGGDSRPAAGPAPRGRSPWWCARVAAG